MHPTSIISTFDGYEKVIKNTLLNKFAIETSDNKIQEVTLEDGSKEQLSSWYYCGLCLNLWLKEA